MFPHWPAAGQMNRIRLIRGLPTDIILVSIRFHVNQSQPQISRNDESQDAVAPFLYDDRKSYSSIRDDS